MTTITVDTSQLRDTLGKAASLSKDVQRSMSKVLGSHAADWKLRLKGPSITAPGEGTWPVGNILNLGRSNERYLKLDDPRGRDSGRSLGAWRYKTRGLTVVATNDAVDADRRSYAEFVHFRGQPTGQAVKDAFEAFEDEMAVKAASDMADIVEATLRAL